MTSSIYQFTGKWAPVPESLFEKGVPHLQPTEAYLSEIPNKVCVWIWKVPNTLDWCVSVQLGGSDMRYLSPILPEYVDAKALAEKLLVVVELFWRDGADDDDNVFRALSAVRLLMT